ncbi:hypothetical protein BHM03_00049659, partial [Ensete ventricosum]
CPSHFPLWPSPQPLPSDGTLRAGDAALRGCCPYWRPLLSATALASDSPGHGAAPCSLTAGGHLLRVLPTPVGGSHARGRPRLLAALLLVVAPAAMAKVDRLVEGLAMAGYPLSSLPSL